ncbi:glycoside hydrolase superfamily [Aspergillus stella-maris]|uniref:glycoside hydrolase superfamily n=1 Tax=Aspergillus stella-maris TaxID=1810926 RepID=UPI003CCD986A
MTLKYATLALVAAQCVAGLRFVMYMDQYHFKNLPGKDQTQGISHAVMGFVPAGNLSMDTPPPVQLPVSLETMRGHLSPDAKVSVAVGGWGPTAEFSEIAKDETSRDRFAKNVAAMLETTGFDGVDIDWEYPGGNGDDYKVHPNSEKVNEVETFPLFIQALRKVIGDEKLLSIATPGKRGDMIAYTAELGPKIWPHVDMVNVMSYDLMNRRDNVTKHHSSVIGSLDSIKAYKEIGAPPEKLNLGMAYYAKYFPVEANADCADQPLGCPTVPMEGEQGEDLKNSGVRTFEPEYMIPIEVPANLTVSTDQGCGIETGIKCPEGTCCSIWGSCGTTDEYCGENCLHHYGECTSPFDPTERFQRAMTNGKVDEELGGAYWFDADYNIFWTWDTPELMTRKFKDIVDAEGLGGVMAWSMGEDTYDFSHMKSMQDGVAARPEQRVEGESGAAAATGNRNQNAPCMKAQAQK